MANPNMALLAGMAQAMGPLCEQVVFVGGYLSHDLEDIMTVIEGRSTVAREVGAAGADVRRHVGQSVAALLDMPAFHNALPGLLSDPEREQTVKARLNQIARLKET